MIRLKQGLGKLFHKIETNMVDQFDQFYADLTRQNSFEAKTSQIQQPQIELNAQKKPTYFRISSRIQPKAQESIKLKNKKPNLQKPKYDQNLTHLNQQQHLLLSRKHKLLAQLQKINEQLKTHKEKQSRIKQSKLQFNTQQMTLKATQLIKKMNKQREEFTKRRKKSIEQLNQGVARSIQSFHQSQSLVQEQQMKQIRRQQIEKRIDERKKRNLQRGIFVKKSHSLIKDLLNFSIVNQHNRSVNDLMEKNDEITKDKMNPELPQIHSNYQKNIKTQTSNRSIKLSQKSHKISPFLQKLFIQQERKKKQQYLKTLQKKRVFIKHKQYAQKFRGKLKSYGQNSMFLT